MSNHAPVVSVTEVERRRSKAEGVFKRPHYIIVIILQHFNCLHAIYKMECYSLYLICRCTYYSICSLHTAKAPPATYIPHNTCKAVKILPIVLSSEQHGIASLALPLIALKLLEGSQVTVSAIYRLVLSSTLSSRELSQLKSQSWSDLVDWVVATLVWSVWARCCLHIDSLLAVSFEF